MKLRLAAVLLAGLLLSACAPTFEVVKVPETAGDRGLVVATLDLDAVITEVQRQQIRLGGAWVQISGRTYYATVKKDHLIVPLASGEYVLESISVRNSLDAALGSTRHTMTRRFRVEAGRATSLGHLVFVPKRETKGEYYVFATDNSAEITALLKKQYPGLYVSLHRSPPVVAGEAKYIEGKAVEAIRGELARAAFLRRHDFRTTQYSHAGLGTIAKVLRDSKGNWMGFDVIDTGTIHGMAACDGRGLRYACLTDDGQLVLVNDMKAMRLPAPGEGARAALAFSDHGVVVVDQHADIYTSLDDGRNWVKTRSLSQKLEPVMNIYDRVDFAVGQKGFYVTFPRARANLPVQVLYSDFQPISYRRIELPPLVQWGSFHETRTGLIVGPQYKANKERENFFVRANGKDSWEERQMPDHTCYRIIPLDDGGSQLRVFCNGAFYNSEDGGRNWALTHKTN
jgi:hypothetical protein